MSDGREVLSALLTLIEVSEKHDTKSSDGVAHWTVQQNQKFYAVELREIDNEEAHQRMQKHLYGGRKDT